jgi:hypothetical protein
VQQRRSWGIGFGARWGESLLVAFYRPMPDNALLIDHYPIPETKEPLKFSGRRI